MYKVPDVDTLPTSIPYGDFLAMECLKSGFTFCHRFPECLIDVPAVFYDTQQQVLIGNPETALGKPSQCNEDVIRHTT